MADQILHMDDEVDGMQPTWLVDIGEEDALIITLISEIRGFPMVLATTFGKVTKDKLLDIISGGTQLYNDDDVDKTEKELIDKFGIDWEDGMEEVRCWNCSHVLTTNERAGGKICNHCQDELTGGRYDNTIRPQEN